MKNIVLNYQSQKLAKFALEVAKDNMDEAAQAYKDACDAGASLLEGCYGHSGDPVFAYQLRRASDLITAKNRDYRIAIQTYNKVKAQYDAVNTYGYLFTNKEN